jgi:hypothetical protein
VKKVTLAPALVKEFQKSNTVWVSVLLEAFPRVEKLVLTTLAWSQSPNKQLKFELGVLKADQARAFSAEVSPSTQNKNSKGIHA